MKILRKTFKHYLKITKEQLSEAGKNENSARWLYQNNFRTPLFMLEALTRVYRDISDKKVFEKLNKHFKAGEDLIGEIDYFYYYAEILEGRKVKQALTQKALEKEKEYNDLLIKKEWLNGKRLKKINKKLKKLPDLSISEETEKIKKFYETEIRKLIDFSQSTDFKFKDIELDVHEMRRKLRWLSIYPQAFLGLFRYADHPTRTPRYIKKYLTEDIINSKYNVFPETLNFKNPILINKTYFLALSWVIAAIGDLKDEGLKTEALEIINMRHPDEKETIALLKKSEKILVPFFKEKNLNNLLHST